MHNDLTASLSEEGPRHKQLLNPMREYEPLFFDVNALCSLIFRPNIKVNHSLIRE